jgi:4-amino-4-deoxy-L-arabinose transferase-like glycosyltransferase
VLFIFLFALFIRVDPILKTPETIRAGYGAFGDSLLYHNIAYNLYKGHGYSGIDNGSALGFPPSGVTPVYEPAITRGPVYPGFLAAVYCLWGDPTAMESILLWHVNWNRVRVVQAVLDALVCLLLFGVMRMLYPDRFTPAFMVAALYSISFYNIFYTRMLLSESVTTFLVAIAIVASLMALKSGQIRYWLIVGAGFGLASLSRPEYILFPFFLAGFIFWHQRHEIRGALKTSAVLFCGLVLVISPWALRNYLTYKQFIPTSVGAMGFNLFKGTYQNGDWQGWRKFPDRIFKSPEMKKEITAWRGKLGYHLKRGTIGLKEYDLRFKSLALKTIREDPLNCFILWIKRLPRLWYQNYIKMYDGCQEPSGIWFIIYFVFSILALILMEPKIRLACAPIFLLFCYMNLVYLPFQIEPRYGVAIYPGLNFLTAIGIWLLGTKTWQRVRPGRSNTGHNE